jgi:hypothetical protein
MSPAVKTQTTQAEDEQVSISPSLLSPLVIMNALPSAT